MTATYLAKKNWFIGVSKMSKPVQHLNVSFGLKSQKSSKDHFLKMSLCKIILVIAEAMIKYSLSLMVNNLVADLALLLEEIHERSFTILTAFCLICALYNPYGA